MRLSANRHAHALTQPRQCLARVKRDQALHRANIPKLERIVDGVAPLRILLFGCPVSMPSLLLKRYGKALRAAPKDGLDPLEFLLRNLETKARQPLDERAERDLELYAP